MLQLVVTKRVEDEAKGPVVGDCSVCEKDTLCEVQGVYVEPPNDDAEPRRLLLVTCTSCSSGLLLEQSHDGHDWSDHTRTWPSDARSRLSSTIPPPLRRELWEARRCFKARSYAATVMMVRRTLEGICSDQGIKNGPRQPLFAALKELRDQGKIEGRLLDWAEALRLLGNEGAHFTGSRVSREDAADALALAEAILDYLYVFTSQYEEFQRRRGKLGKS